MLTPEQLAAKSERVRYSMIEMMFRLRKTQRGSLEHGELSELIISHIHTDFDLMIAGISARIRHRNGVDVISTSEHLDS